VAYTTFRIYIGRNITQSHCAASIAWKTGNWLGHLRTDNCIFYKSSCIRYCNAVTYGAYQQQNENFELT